MMHGSNCRPRSGGRPIVAARPAEPLEARRLCSAYTLSDVASFGAGVGAANPGSVALDSRGNLWGAAGDGAGGGVIFEVARGAHAVTTVIPLPGSQGPGTSLVIDSADNVFCSANAGDSRAYVFEVPAGGGAAASVGSALRVAPGAAPQLAVFGRSVFGVTTAGGNGGLGLLFQVNGPSSDTLASFGPATGSPSDLIADAAGNLFGACSGSDGRGALFELPAGASQVRILATLGSAGTAPQGLAIDGAGNVFGATSAGGAGGVGAVFELPAGGSQVQTLASLSGSDIPTGNLLVDASGNVFGAASGKTAADAGSVFEVPAGSGTATTVAAFGGANGQSPDWLTPDGAGGFFGTTSAGGPAGSRGVVFQLAPAQAGGAGLPLSVALSGRLPAATLVAGQRTAPITQTVRITNTGSSLYTGPVTVNLLLSPDGSAASGDPVAAATRVLRLKPGASAVVPLILRAVPATDVGTFFFAANVADASGASAEAASAGTITSRPPFVDLTGSFVHVPSAVKAGRTLVFTLAITENGNVPVTGSLPIDIFAATGGTVDASATDLGIVTRRVNVLPGHRQIVSVSVPAPATLSGPLFLIAKLDPDNTLNDTNPADNTFASSTAVTFTS